MCVHVCARVVLYVFMNVRLTLHKINGPQVTVHPIPVKSAILSLHEGNSFFKGKVTGDKW